MKEYKLKINSNDYHVVVSGLSNGRADVMVNGQSYSVEIADAQAASEAGKPASAPAVTATAPAPAAAKPAAGGAVKSPLRASCSTFRSPSATASARASG